jgi:diguanylate cyclase (GGDEF)-like protein
VQARRVFRTEAATHRIAFIANVFAFGGPFSVCRAEALGYIRSTPMNVFDRQDRLLVAGLGVALTVLFTRQIRYLLDLARDVEETSGLALLPALMILTVLFVFHQQGKRQEAKAQAAAAEAGARQAEARAEEMERLVLFGQALGRSLDVDSIRDIVIQHLPKLAGTDEAWVMVQNAGHWQELVGLAHESRPEIEQLRERIADRALVGDAEKQNLYPVSAEGHLCLPLTAGGNAVGVLAVPDSAGPFTEGRQRVLAAAAALLGISLRNAQLFHETRECSLRDGLTGCFNRTHAREVIDVELRRARRAQRSVSLIMFDLDHFKDINDRYGHLCGDAVLAAVGARMRGVLRGSDLKCRYGGEEFLVLLPETPLDGARQVADTLRRELSEMPIQWKDDTLTITASFGVTTSLPAEIETEALISRADAALYQAKEHGRNCVHVSVVPAVA